MGLLTEVDVFSREVSTYNSGSREDSKTIPKAIPFFSWPGNSMTLIRILPDVNGSRSFNMVATKPGQNQKYLSQLLDKLATRFHCCQTESTYTLVSNEIPTATAIFSKSRNSKEPSPIMLDVTGSLNR
jgi:hypothetical protein